MKRLFLLISVSLLLFLQIGCGGGGSDSSSGSYTTYVTIVLGKTQTVSQETGTVVKATNQIPASVSKILITISARDMQTITRTITVAGQSTITESFEVPVGASRQFLVECMDTGNNVIFKGSVVVDVGAEPMSLSIVTVNTDPVPPVFSGLSTITGITANTMVLNWSSATDNVTDPGKIQYLIYVATSPSGENFASPTFTSLQGATSYTVTNLTPGTTYYFVVKAKDGYGNVDGNTVERSATTLDSVPPVFSGLSTITGITDTTMVLHWSPATDNVTDPGKIQYLIYVATSPSGENFASPTFTSPQGATSFTVTNLTPGTTYYFVVRAKDESGNVDGNTVERSAITFVYHAISGSVYQSGCEGSSCGLSGVTMTLSGAPGNPTTTTDDTGSYSFSGVANGSYTVIPSLAGYNFTPASAPVTVNGGSVTTVNFTASPNIISGRVIDSQFSGSIGLAGVTMTLSGGTLIGNVTTTTGSAPYGDYYFYQVANGNYTVTPSLAGYTFTPASAPVTVNDASVTVGDFTAQRAVP